VCFLNHKRLGGPINDYNTGFKIISVYTGIPDSSRNYSWDWRQQITQRRTCMCHSIADGCYRHWCVQYLVSSWVAVSLPSLLCTLLSDITSRSIVNVTAVYSTQCHHQPQYRYRLAVYSTQCHHEPQYRYRHCCEQYSVTSSAAVSLTSLLCTVLSAIMSRSIAMVTAVYSTHGHQETQYRYCHCCVEYGVPWWAAVSLTSLLCTALSATMSRSIAIVTAIYSTQCHHEPQNRYRHCCVQYSVTSWDAVSLSSLQCTVLSAIMIRSIAIVTAVYGTQCHHEPQYR